MASGPGIPEPGQSTVPAWLEPLGLFEAPFGSDDERFDFLDEPRRQSLNMLIHLTRFSEELLLITGPAGAGKSWLLQRCLARADDTWRLCHIAGAATADATGLVQQIAACAGVDRGRLQGDPLTALTEKLGRLRTEQLPVIVVDDANALSDDALEILIRLASLAAPHGKLVRLLLFAEPALAHRLGAKRFRDIVPIHRLDLPPFTAQESALYLRHRLGVAGMPAGSGDDPLTPKRLRRLHKASAGRPGRLNGEANRLFEELFATARPSRRALPVRPAWIGLGGALLAIAATGLLFHDRISGLMDPSKAVQSLIAMELEPLEPPTAMAKAPTTASSASVVQAPTALEAPGHDEVLRDPTGSPVTPPAVAPAPTVPVSTPAPAPPPVAAPEARRAPTISAIQPAPVIGSWEPQTLLLEGEGFAADSRVEVSWQGGEVRTIPAERVAFIAPNRLEVTLTTGDRANQWYIRVRTRGGVSEPLPFRVEPPPAAESWLWAAPAEHYTLQLLAAREVTTLQAFTAQAALPEPVATFIAERNGQPMHLLVQGVYPNREAALAAINALSPQARAAEPWPRPIGALRPSRPSPAAALPASAREATVARRNIEGDAWLWARNPAHFTIQLISGSDSATLETFLADLELPGPLARYRMEQDGSTWHVLVMGDYATRAEAQAAAAALPPRLRRSQPWLRPFADIHETL